MDQIARIPQCLRYGRWAISIHHVPTPNGVGFDQLMNILEELQRNFQIVGYSFTEFASKGDDEIEKLQKLIEYGCKVT